MKPKEKKEMHDNASSRTSSLPFQTASCSEKDRNEVLGTSHHMNAFAQFTDFVDQHMQFIRVSNDKFMLSCNVKHV